MDQRKTVVGLAQAPGANLAQLARRFGISRKTLYKWIKRSQLSTDLSDDWAQDRSRRPDKCPWRTGQATERKVIKLREKYGWGPRKLHGLLPRDEQCPPPSISTIAAILKRHQLVTPEESLKRKEFVRFERSEPNELWQADFKGPFAVGSGKCHPLTIIDDHSRFGLGVRALPGETGELTRPAMIEVFRCYGLPLCMLFDNGSCWGRAESLYTAFSAWLLRIGIRVIYARPFHPQTKGKNERFNRTLKAEAITGRNFSTLDEWQRHFDRFLNTYNNVRPHEALGMAVPASKYRLSPRTYPEKLPAIEYLETDVIRQVGPAGYISVKNERYQVGRAFSGQPVALRSTNIDGVLEIFYCYQRVATIDQRNQTYEQTGY